MKYSERLELIKGAGIDSPALKFLSNSDLRDLAIVKGIKNKRYFIKLSLRLQILKYERGLK